MGPQVGHGESGRQLLLDELGQTAPTWGFGVVAAVVRGGAAGPPRIESQPEVEVDPGGVGLLSLCGVVGMVQEGDLSAGTDQSAPKGGHRGAQAAHLAHREAAPGESGWATAELFAGPDVGDQLGILVAGLEPLQGLYRGTADDAVHGQSGVALEVAQGLHGGVPEDAVHAPGIEAEGAQALLELGDVVTPEHRGPAIEEAVAQPEPGLDQGAPGLRAADAVDPQSPPSLEGLDGRPGGRAETAGRIGRGPQPEDIEPTLDVSDRFTLLPLDQG